MCMCVFVCVFVGVGVAVDVRCMCKCTCTCMRTRTHTRAYEYVHVHVYVHMHVHVFMLVCPPEDRGGGRRTPETEDGGRRGPAPASARSAPRAAACAPHTVIRLVEYILQPLTHKIKRSLARSSHMCLLPYPLLPLHSRLRVAKLFPFGGGVIKTCLSPQP